MRLFLIISVLVIVPFVAVLLLRTVTGDSMSAIVFGLTLFVTVASWFSGRSAAAGRQLS